MFKSFGLYTDLYELTMARGYFNEGRKNETAVFDYFFRKHSFDGNYTVFAGLNPLLEYIKDFNFTNQQRLYLKKQGFDDPFLDYLANFNFEGTIQAPKEGELVFPNEPVIRVEGPLPQVQLLETLILNTINFQSLVATKARRMCAAAGSNDKLIDFGLRRAHGFGGYQATRAAYIGGFHATSNVQAGMDFDIPVSGTMAHSWIQSYSSELEAFTAYAKHYPDQCILLVDTYDTIQCGIPNAIKVARKLKHNGHHLVGIRLDSGDLCTLSKKARMLLDEAGFSEVAIAVSNQIDEYKIKELRQQKCPIDVYGIGTRLVTAKEDPALDGVYKLAQMENQPVLKLSESREKITLPGKKQVVRLYNTKGRYKGDLILLEQEDLPAQNEEVYTADGKKEHVPFDTAVPIHQTVWSGGNIIEPNDRTADHRNYCNTRFSQLPAPWRSITPSDRPYPVYHSKKLYQLQHQLIEKFNSSHQPV